MVDNRFRSGAASAIAAALAVGALPAAAQTTEPAATEDAQEQAQSAQNAGEIVVTATKRSERLEDVPAALSVVTDEQLRDLNAQSLSDYITRLPGVVFNDYQPGISEVVIRGIQSTTYHEQGQTTTGYYLNEIPLQEPGFPIAIPDVDTFDLERVEVLRGPQGTLFGSSSLGGAVNYVVKTADPTGVDAAAQGLIGTTKNAAGALNYAAKAMINLPIVKDKLAVRVMGLQRFDAGFLDATNAGVDGSNDFRVRGLRGSIVFTPTQATKITYLSTYQDTRLDDQTYVRADDLYTRLRPLLEPQETSFLLNSLRVEQDLGFADLTAFGSIIDKDNTTVLSNPYPYVTGIATGDDSAYSLGTADANIKTGEIRLTSKDDAAVFGWLIGSSYLRSKKHSYDRLFQPGAEAFIDANPDIYGENTGSLLAPDDRIYGYRSDSTTDDFGIFGELTLRPVRAVELTVGGRFYANEYSTSILNMAGATNATTIRTEPIGASVTASEQGFTPRVTLSLEPSENFLAYFTYSQGYRIGGINPNAGLLESIPQSYDSDTIDNYEAGIKVSLLDRSVFVDATVFTLDWSDIQARLFAPPNDYSYVVNAGSANVAGAELALTVQPSRYVSFSTNATYSDAQLTSFLPDTYAPGGGYASGTPLPGTSRWSVSNTLQFVLPDTATKPSLQLAHRYLSKAPVAFGSTFTRGDYNIFDARLSLTELGSFRVMGFINNIFDSAGVLNAPFGSDLAPAASIVRPRTFGLRIDWSL